MLHSVFAEMTTFTFGRSPTPAFGIAGGGGGGGGGGLQTGHL